MKFEKHSLIAIVGTVWFITGIFLLLDGCKLIFFTAFIKGDSFTPILNIVLYAFTGAVIPSIIVIVLLSLLLGYAKSRWAIVRVTKKTLQRIYPMPGLVRISNLYRLHEGLLMIAVIGMSRILKILHVPADILGVINIAIGSALINGAIVYFRFAIRIKESIKTKAKL